MTATRRLAELVERITGIVVPDRELGRLHGVAEQRARVSGQGTVERYVRYLADGGDSDEWRALLGFITVNESYLFRGSQQLEALGHRVVPGLIASRPSGRLSVWSAGCARGEEAATVAIVLAETLGTSNTRWEVLATDLDDNSLAQARTGRFGVRAMSRVSADLLDRYFVRDGKMYRLVPILRDRITYRRLNLVSEPLDLPEAPFDVIFLRNVLIYFRPAAQRRVVEAVAANLAADGALFVGPSESLWQLRSVLQPQDLGTCFCYRLGPQAQGEPMIAAPGGSGGDGPGERPASDRRSEETRRREDRERAAMPPAPDTRSRREVAAAVSRLIHGGAAISAADQATEASRRSPDDPVLRAIEGRALEASGELERAVAAYRAALYLVPSMCEVRFMMAECLLRLGRRDRGGRELRSVLASLSARSCTPTPDMESLGRPTEDHMEWRAREVLHSVE